MRGERLPSYSLCLMRRPDRTTLAAAEPGDCWPTDEQVLLLRAALQTGAPALDAYRAWRSRVSLNALDPGSVRLFPLLYLNLSPLGVADDLMPRLRRVHDQWAARNRDLVAAVAPALDAWRLAGIDTLVLKGLALSAHAYPSPAGRPMDDVDVLVPVGQALAARDVLVAAGWRPRSPLDEETLTVRHAVGFQRGELEHLDLHWHVTEECGGAEADAGFWGRAMPLTVNDVRTRMLCPADLLLHICVHGLKWSTLPTVRWAADAVVLLRASGAEMDWARLVDQAERLRLVLPVKAGLGYLRRTLDVAVPDEVLAALARVRVSRRLRAEYRVKTERRTARRQVLYHWLQHRRLLGRHSILGATVRFPRYLQKLWGVSSLAALVPYMAVEGARRVWPRRDRP